MIAAGSLFTSCVENTEPAGIKDLRGAKAEYLAALSNLRAADAEKVKAEATLVQAQAATEQARAALQQAKAKEQELINNKKEADDEIAIQKARKDAEVYLAQQEQVLAKAEEDLRAYLVKVEEQSKQLTKEEYQIVVAYTTAYNTVVDKQKGVRDKEAALYEVTYNTEKGGVNNVEAAKAGYEQTIAIQTANAARSQALYDAYKEFSEEEIARYDVWAEEYQKLTDSVYAYEYDKAELEKAAAIAKVQNKEAIDNFFKAVAKAQEPIEDYVAAVEEGFVMDYTGEDAFELPSRNIPVVNTFRNKAKNVDARGEHNYIKVVSGKDLMEVKYNNPEKAFKAIFGNEEDPDAASLASIIDALKRDSVVVDQLIKDTAGLAAAVAKVNDEYKAVKDTLVKGVAAYKAVVDSQAKKVLADTAKAQAERAYTAAVDVFEADTAAVFAAINNFVKVWNSHTDENLDKNDSTEVWNAFIDVMKARKKAFPYEGEYENFYFYSYNKDGELVKDSVKFVDMEFSGIQRSGSDFKCLYGRKSDGTFSHNILNRILSESFEQREHSGYLDNHIETPDDTKIKLSEISVSGLYGDASGSATNAWSKLFFGKYYINRDTKTLWVLESGKGREFKIDSDIPAVKTAYTAKENAKTAAERAAEGIQTAKANYYKNIYCKFWGLAPVETIASAADSLTINYSEKTYTDPYVLPVFEAKNSSGKIFDNGNFVWRNIGYNKDDSELKLIAEQLGQNNIKIDGAPKYTLYAKTLAAAQIYDLAKNWKENSTALAELEEVVASVEAAYVLAGLEVAVAQAEADSVVTAVLGEDVVEAALAEINKGQTVEKTASYLWSNPTQKAKWFVDVEKDAQGAYKLDAFTEKFCEAGEYKLGGQQLEAAEENIPHYAAVVNEHAEALAYIAAAQKNCGELANIIDVYVNKIAHLDEYTDGTDPVDQVKKVANDFAKLLDEIQDIIDTAEEDIAKAEGSIKKLEAGYDQTQINIENAKDDLAKAQQALEQAEVEFAVAEAAYEAVLANHGITE